MAARGKAGGASAPAPAYDPETLYRVALNRIVAMPGDPDTRLSPAHDNRLRGRVLNEIPADAIAAADPVEEARVAPEPDAAAPGA